MSLRTIIARSVRPIAVSALCLGAALLMAMSPASAAEPVGGQQRLYSGWGSGLIGVTLVQPVGPYQGFENQASRLKQVAPVGFLPVKATMPTELPVPLEHIFHSS